MSSFTAEDRAAMADSVRRLLADLCTEAGIRRAMESEAGYDPALWTALVDLGVPGLVIDPAHDGLGGGPVELEAIMEEAGAALLPAPLFAVTMAAALIAACGDAAASDRLLPGLARGRIATVAVNSFLFKQPISVGDVVSFYASVSRVGRTSITVDVQVYAQRFRENEPELLVVKVTEATLTYVATHRDGSKREVGTPVR